MPDKFGRPTFQDWVNLGGLISNVQKTQKENQAEKLGQELMKNPKLDLSNYDPKVARVALGYYHQMKGDELALDANQMKSNIANLEYKRNMLMQRYVEAKSLLEQGRKEEASQIFQDIYNALPSPFKAKVKNDEVTIYDSTDSKKTPLQKINLSEIPPEKLDEMVLNNLAPENYIKNTLNFRQYAHKHNINSLANPHILRNKNTGEIMYVAHALDWRHPEKPILTAFRDPTGKDIVSIDKVDWSQWEPAGTAEHPAKIKKQGVKQATIKDILAVSKEKRAKIKEHFTRYTNLIKQLGISTKTENTLQDMLNQAKTPEEVNAIQAKGAQATKNNLQRVYEIFKSPDAGPLTKSTAEAALTEYARYLGGKLVKQTKTYPDGTKKDTGARAIYLPDGRIIQLEAPVTPQLGGSPPAGLNRHDMQGRAIKSW